MFSPPSIPGELLRLYFCADACIDTAKIFLDHHPRFHPTAKLKGVIKSLNNLTEEERLLLLTASVESTMVQIKKAPWFRKIEPHNLAKVGPIWIAFHTTENFEILTRAISHSFKMATAKYGDPSRMGCTSAGDGDKRIEQENAEFFRSCGGDPENAYLNKYCHAFYDVATKSNASALGELLFNFFPSILMEHEKKRGKVVQQCEGSHSHDATGKCIHTTGNISTFSELLKDDDHWSVNLARCGNCSKQGNLMRCGGCATVAYCSKDCQKTAWKLHKNDCVKH